MFWIRGWIGALRMTAAAAAAAKEEDGEKDEKDERCGGADCYSNYCASV